MPDQETSTLRKIVWSELFPGLILVRCFRIAVQVRLMACGAVGVFLMLAGWLALSHLFSTRDAIQRDFEQTFPTGLIGDRLGGSSSVLGVLPGEVAPVLPAPGRDEGFGGWNPSSNRQLHVLQTYWGVWEHIGAPWQRLFEFDAEAKTFGGRLTRFAFLLLCGLWAVAVWAYFAGVIARAAAVELATHDRAKTVCTFRYAATKWRACFGGPVFPLAGAILLAVPIVCLGWLLRWDATSWITALAWPVLLVHGALMAFLLVGLLFGWPLMFASVGVEGGDCFDAIGQAYQYVFHRPLEYLFYALVATGLGALGWLLVSSVVAVIVGLTYGAAEWGAGGTADFGSLSAFSGWLIAFWVGTLKLLGVGFLYSYFFTASTAIYFLLRRSADATEMDEVRPEEEDLPAQPARPETSDSANTPPAKENLPKDQAE